MARTRAKVAECRTAQGTIIGPHERPLPRWRRRQHHPRGRHRSRPLHRHPPPHGLHRGHGRARVPWAGVDVRGAAPGTRETDLLHPSNLVDKVHAIMLAGGSAWGLEAATGAVRWLEERGVGLDVAVGRLPMVPAAVLFDLLVGDMRIRPDAAAGYAACAAASSADPAEGNVGAGAGAVVGKIFGIQRAMKGGIGTASVTVDGMTVGALVACNALGDVIDPDTAQVMAGRPHRRWPGPARHTPRPAARPTAPAPAGGHQHHHRRRGHRCHPDQSTGAPPGHCRARRSGTQHQPGAHHVGRRHPVQPGHGPCGQKPGHDGAGHHGGRSHRARHRPGSAGGTFCHHRRRLVPASHGRLAPLILRRAPAGAPPAFFFPWVPPVMSPRMSKALRSALLSFRDLVLSAGPLAFLAVGLLVLAYWWLNPTPPKSVTLATGPAQSAYEEFGKRYQKALAADGH